MLDAVRSMWWATLIIGIIAVILGLIAVLMPVAALKVIVLFVALYALLTGIFGVIGGVRAIRHDAAGWLELLWGLLGVAIGVYVFAEPKTAAVVLFLVYGIWAVLRGGFDILAAIRLRHAMVGWVAMLLSGIAWFVLGVLFLVAPGATAVATTIVWGLIVALIGVLTIIAAAFAHRAIKDLERAESTASGLLQY